MSLRERLALPDPERPTGAESHDAPNQAYQELKFYARIHQKNLGAGIFAQTNNHLESIRTTAGKVDSEQSEGFCLPQY